MQKLVITTITGGLLAASSAVAGDFTVPVAPAAPAAAPAGGALTVGYNSAYVFRGLNLGTDQVYSQLDYGFQCPLTGLDLEVGAWYSTTQNAGFNTELNLYASTSKDLGFATATVGGIFYQFDNGSNNATEVFFSLSKEYYGFETSLTYFWDVQGGSASENDGYLELGLGKSLNLGGYDLDLSATVGYLVEEGEFSHATLKASHDIALGSATLSPYVAYSFELDDLEQYGAGSTTRQNEFFAGASLSVSF